MSARTEGPAGPLRSLAARLAALVAEMNSAQRRMVVLRTALDRYSMQPDQPPATYAEFLARTSGVLLREPPARVRLSGRPVG